MKTFFKVAICLFVFGISPAIAGTVNLTLTLNQDVVWGTDASGLFDFGVGGSAFMSSTTAVNKGQLSSNGLPDNGAFAAVNLKHPAITLAPFNNNGFNAYQPASAATPTVNAPVATQGQYKEVHVYASSSGATNSAKFKVVAHYTDATTTTSAIFTVPDWIGTTSGIDDYVLMDGIGRVNSSNVYDATNGNVFAIFGFRTSIDPTKTLASVDIVVTTNSANAINFFGGVATTTNTLTNAAPTASSVTISGTATVGNTLTGAYTYADADSDAEGTSTFRWLRGATAITGATSSTYTLVAADSGQSITFEVTPVAATGTLTGTAVASVGTTILNSAPTPAVSPSVAQRQ